jgi:iron complex outermembrane receptor protein
MRLCVVITAVCLCIVGLSVADDVHASIRKQTNIPAEGLGPALQTLAKERNFQIVFVSDEVNALRTQGAIGEFTPEEALKQLLKGTGLTYRFFGENAISIIPVTSTSSPSTSAVDSQPSSRSSENSNEKEGAKSDSFRLAQSSQGVVQNSSAVGGDAQSSSGTSKNSPQLTEILVTAQKRTERLQDVPVSITVLDPNSLAENGQNRLVDYFATVPGLSLNGSAFGGGTQYLVIRGLSTGEFQNPSVATVIDDVPTGSSSALSFGNFSAADLDPGDLDHIEVLKGPQGTLYGADSIGGIIKYVTKDPSTTALSGRVEVDGVDIPGGGLGYGVRVAVNIPVSDQFAVRLSGFARRDPGYIDDLTTGQKNINSADVYGGHFAALWMPEEDVSLKVAALIQKTDANGADYVNSNGLAQFPEGDLKQTGLPGTGPYTTENQLYTATLKAKVAGLDVVSVTGYGVTKLDNTTDDTGLFGGPAPSYSESEFGVPGVNLVSHYETEKLTQELRISSSIGHWLDWRVGGFYTRESSPGTPYEEYVAETLVGSAVGVQYYATEPTLNLSEHAIFGDATVHITDRFDLQLGGRESWNKQNYESVGSGRLAFDLFGVTPFIYQPLTHTSGDAFTYLVTPEFKISRDLMVYARIASGYRVGGPNLGVTAIPAIPSSFKPDTTTNYELGVKGDLFEHQLTFDAAAYYIDWKNVQVEQLYNYYSYTTNAGNAKSEGLEASVQAHPARGLTITAQGSYDNAVLTQNELPPTVAFYALAGDRLPYSLRWSGGLTANQDISLSGEWIGYVGGAVNYVGSRPSEFASGPPPYTLATERPWMPAYTQINLRTGLRHDSWLINLFANNVGDKRGIIGGVGSGGYAIGLNGGGYATVIQPRTIGLSVVRTF